MKKKKNLGGNFGKIEHRFNKIMTNNISIEKNNLVIKIPLKAKRFDPYTETDAREMDNIVGVITNDEVGFAHWIDRDYKGKDDDVSNFFYIYLGEKKDFINLCKKLKIDVIEYPICGTCDKSIY